MVFVEIKYKQRWFVPLDKKYQYAKSCILLESFTFSDLMKITNAEEKAEDQNVSTEDQHVVEDKRKLEHDCERGRARADHRH